MGVVVPGLRVLRLVLLGGALSVLWLLLTAADSSAAAAGDDRSLPLAGQVPVVRDVVATARQHETAKTAVPHSEEQRSTPKSSPRHVARSVTHPVERTTSGVVSAADGTEGVSSTVADVAESTTSVVASAPVVEPVTKPVVDEVVEPVLMATNDLSTTVLDQTRATIDGVDDLVVEVDEVVEGVADDTVGKVVGGVVTAPGDVVPPTMPAQDAVAPVASEPATGQASAEHVMAGSAAGEGPAATNATLVLAHRGFGGSTGETSWLTDQSTSMTSASTPSEGDSGASPHDPLAPSSPVGLAPGCAPGVSAGSGGQLDLTAYRSTISMPVTTMVPTGGSGHSTSVPGPSVLPGFSPE